MGKPWISSRYQRDMHVWGVHLMDKVLPIPFIVLGIFVTLLSSSRITVAVCWIIFLAINILFSQVIYRFQNSIMIINIARNVASFTLIFAMMQIAGTGVPIWLMTLPMVFSTPFISNSMLSAILKNAVFCLLVILWMAALGEEIRLVITASLVLVFVAAVSLISVNELLKKDRLLTEALEKIKDSNKDLEQFAYVASHDLQEPLRMVASYVKLLERRNKDKLDTDSKEFIDFAADGAIRMQGLIDDLLTYSRVDTKGKPFVSTECRTVYEKTIKNLEIPIADYRAKVTHDNLPTVMADEGQLVQLFQNLIGNALKFCKDKVPEVHVRTQQDDKYWKFGIRDNGIGIAPEYQERVFQIFQRLHSREEYKGTGIGLAVCKKIVERHGGRIWIESEAGKGTTFWFTIPNRIVSEQQTPA